MSDEPQRDPALRDATMSPASSRDGLVTQLRQLEAFVERSESTGDPLPPEAAHMIARLREIVQALDGLTASMAEPFDGPAADAPDAAPPALGRAVTHEFIVRQAMGTADIDAARRLILEHVEERATTPGIEHMRADATRLPGPYTAPRGAIWVAASGDEVVGCVALRPLPGRVGEVKRMFVARAWRGHGIGRALLESLIAWARDAGYQRLRLGTLADMLEAQALYRSLGFAPIERYRADEMIDTAFFELDLAQ